MTVTPRRVEYAGPEGWTVWVDEDGVHLRTPKGSALEAGDLDRLLALVTEVKGQCATGAVPTPKPPTSDEYRAMYGARREEYDAKRASHAVYQALAPNTDAATPF